MSSRRIKISDESNSDIISNLPDNVTECILAKLPIEDAIRARMLSKKWRYKWVRLPYLVFDDNGISALKHSTYPLNLLENEEELLMNKVIKFIDRVLFHHDGPVLQFTLSIHSLISCSDIDHQIIFLSKKNVEDFTFEMWRSFQHKLHSQFFSFQYLTNLRLRGCLINLPLDFGGFKSLTTLMLDRITIGSDALKQLILRCPLLEKLQMHQIYGLDCLSIMLLNLQIYTFSAISNLCALEVSHFQLNCQLICFNFLK